MFPAMTMMDTHILFRDGRIFNDAPSSTTSESADSISSSDGVETFSADLNSWNYDSGLGNEFEFMLDIPPFEEPFSGEDLHSIVNSLENTIDENIAIEQKPLLNTLSELSEIKKETIELKGIVKKETYSSHIDIQYDVEKIKKEIPNLDEIVTASFPEYSVADFSNNFAVNDLPPNLDLCAFINEEESAIPREEPVVKNVKIEPAFNPNSEIHIKEEHTTTHENLTLCHENSAAVCEIKVEKGDIACNKKINKNKPKFQAGRKRIDLVAQRYIIDNDIEEDEEENVDVETISESENNPVLEAGDLDSLLKQFEATEVKLNESSNNPPVETNNLAVNNVKDNPKTNIKSKLPETHHNVPKKDVQKEKNYLEAKSLKSKEQKPKTATTLKNQVVQNKNKPTIPNATSSNNKNIIEALPRELINRIKESGKRKRIEIIDPVPNNAAKRKKLPENVNLPQSTSDSNKQSGKNQSDIGSAVRAITLDHSYCVVPTAHKKSPKKDSGYLSSAEEEDKVLSNQPIVKNADGKLMVSLLKVNTIKANNLENQKKKLNIEEYKKRRLGVLNTPNSSSSNSPISSTCNSPSPEDEITKRLKHEEKLRKMAEELLNTPPKSAVVCAVKPVVKEEAPVPAEPVVVVDSPANMIKITYVSIGVNTEITGRNPLAPVEKLEEIKPLLKNASVKIDSSSLITSMIENIPKIIKPDKVVENEPSKEVHGEDKTIIFLPKDRKPPETAHAGVQTSIVLVGDNKRRYRRRKDSTTSTSSSSSCDVNNSTRSNSQGSAYSKSSRSSRSTSISSSSSRSSNRTYSRSPSPRRLSRKRYGYDKEYIQEVEERRVVYVGKLAPKTTKQDLYRRFSKFGPIKTISLHFRDHGDNYGFVTYENKLDAYAAIEHGNDDPYDIHYDLSFGGRRLFCKTSYSDLDNMRDDFGYDPLVCSTKPSRGDSFDRLLQEMQEKLKRRKL